MLVHAEGDVRETLSSNTKFGFRGISDEFISPIIIGKLADIPVATVENGI